MEKFTQVIRLSDTVLDKGLQNGDQVLNPNAPLVFKLFMPKQLDLDNNNDAQRPVPPAVQPNVQAPPAVQPIVQAPPAVQKPPVAHPNVQVFCFVFSLTYC